MALAGGLHWEEHGAGAPVLLSSGLGGSGSYWSPNIAALAKGHRVITYDHRGTGRSERNIDGMLTVDRMAEDMLTVMDAAGVDRAAIVGHAAGGLAGLSLALSAPERVRGVAVVNGWAHLHPYTARCFDARLALLRDSGPRAYLHAQPLFLYPQDWIAEHHDRLVLEEEEQLAHFPGVEMMQRRIAAVRLFDIRKRLREISVRTLCMMSDDDMLVPPSCSLELADGIAEAQLVRIGRGGHACNVTQAERFNGWLQAWLEWEERE